MPVRVGIFLIASAVIVLAWLKEEDEPEGRDRRICSFNHLPLWYLEIFLVEFTVWLVMTTLENNWWDSY